MSLNDKEKSRPLFDVGQISITKRAAYALHDLHVMPSELVLRHQYGDWGVLNDAGRIRNAVALLTGRRIFSIYEIREKAIWVVTEADQLTTTIFTQEESGLDYSFFRTEKRA